MCVCVCGFAHTQPLLCSATHTDMEQYPGIGSLLLTWGIWRWNSSHQVCVQVPFPHRTISTALKDTYFNRVISYFAGSHLEEYSFTENGSSFQFFFLMFFGLWPLILSQGICPKKSTNVEYVFCYWRHVNFRKLMLLKHSNYIEICDWK